MKLDLHTRRALAIFFVGSFALVSNLLLFGREAKRYSSPYPESELAYYDPWNELTMYKRRFAKIRGDLDPNRVMGYVSDNDSSTHFAFTQYVLAPVILTRSEKAPLAVGNFKSGTIPPELLTNAPRALVTDYGNGVALFAARTK